MTRKILSHESLIYNIITGIIILFVVLFALITHVKDFDISIDTIALMLLPSILSVCIQTIRPLKDNTRMWLIILSFIATFIIAMWVAKDIPTGPILVPAH